MTKNESIRQYSMAQVGNPYVYGATGKTCTPGLRQQQMKQYPTFAPTIERHCPVLSGKQSVCVGCKWQGMNAFDCAQLVRRAAEAAGFRLPSGAKSQFNSKNPHSGWAAGGPIDQLPYDQVAFLYRRTADGGVPHTGTYTGDGWVVDARGHAQGVMRTLLNAYKWTDFRVLNGQELVPGVPLLGNIPVIEPEPKKKKDEAVVKVRDLMVISGQPLMRGQDVLDVQAALINQGYSVGEKGPDGVYGWDTEKAVRQFQGANGLPATGVWTETERAVLDYSKRPVEPPPQTINRAEMLRELDNLNRRQSVIIKALREVG